VVPELDAAAAPPIAESGAWFVARHAESWRQARSLATDGALVVLDGDPFKGLWYNVVYAADGWPGVDVTGPLYRELVAGGALSFPDLYVVLGATEAQLRARRDLDEGRTRRNFEKHLRLVTPQREYFAALVRMDASRVLFLDSSSRATLAGSVIAAIEALPAGAPDSTRLLDHAIAWAEASRKREGAYP
jgi:hypothetical protein